MCQWNHLHFHLVILEAPEVLGCTSVDKLGQLSVLSPCPRLACYGCFLFESHWNDRVVERQFIDLPNIYPLVNIQKAIENYHL